MSVGIDLSGRALRWQREGAPVETQHVLLGCPPYAEASGTKDYDERITWGNPKAFRPQVCDKRFQVAPGDHERPIYTADLLSIEAVWRDLAKGEDVWENATKIADALKARLPAVRNEQGKLAFTIPNRLNEDAQDALLRALTGLHADVSLLWRPVAAMLYWLDAGDGQKAFPDNPNIEENGAVWVLDLDSAGFEMTRLTWKRHEKDNEWIAPVRACATETERKDAQKYIVLISAWSEIFSDISERNQLYCCQTAPDVQEHLESDAREFDVWVADSLRWRKVHVRKPESLNATWKTLQWVCQVRNPGPAQGDVILVHGWLASLDPLGLERVLTQLWTGRKIRLLPITAVAQGARLFAQRRKDNLPTYYDTLPAYSIWTSQNPPPPGEPKQKFWPLVAPDQEVEPGSPWQLPADNPLRTAFCINRHRDVFSMLVRRLPCDDPDFDYARRLRVGLHKMLTNDLHLTIDVTVEAARGNARFTVTAQGDKRPFVAKDGQQGINNVALTYARDPEDRVQGKETLPEPEHKGYLEAQPVIGRIHDDPTNIEMLRLLVRCSCEVEARPILLPELHDKVKHYRGLPPHADVNHRCTFLMLERWGWVGPHHPNNQPTRGLFGTRSLPNREISGLADSLANRLWAGGHIPAGLGDRNNWSKRNNYCHGNASHAYKEHIRALLGNNAPFPSWSEAHGPGFVLGDRPDDIQLLVNYCVNAHFGDATQAKMFCWSVFRMLCWHTEIVVTPEIMCRYLVALVQRLHHFNLLAPHDVPRKNVLMSILFALRVREKDPDFLIKNNDDLRTSLLALIDPPDPPGILSGVPFPPSMLAHMGDHFPGNFSEYVARFIRKTDTVADRELGSSIGTMQ